MTQEEAKKQKVCTKCKWCIGETINHSCWVEYKFKCTNSVVAVDPVTGDETYLDCLLINRNGECEMYEENETSFLKILFGKIGKKQ